MTFTNNLLKWLRCEVYDHDIIVKIYENKYNPDVASAECSRCGHVFNLKDCRSINELQELGRTKADNKDAQRSRS